MGREENYCGQKGGWGGGGRKEEGQTEIETTTQSFLGRRCQAGRQYALIARPSNPACAGIFSGSSHTSDLKTGTPVATLPGAWRYRVSAGTGRPGVSIL